MNQKSSFLTDIQGKPITVYHGTYYNFDYFYPLCHFGPEAAAKIVLGEGKWKRDANIDITKPKIIPVLLKKLNYIEIPDILDHYYNDFKSVLFMIMCKDQISDFIKALSLKDKKDFKKQTKIEREKLLNKQIKISWEFDFICQPFTELFGRERLEYELSLETLNLGPSIQNLFIQRMIRYFESIGIDGFKYKNFIETDGEMSYIIFRQNAVKRQDKELPEIDLYVSDSNLSELTRIQSEFKLNHSDRFLSKDEIDMLSSRLYDFFLDELNRKNFI